MLAANGVAVISGLACGIDAAAHEGAGTMQRANCLLRIDEGPCELKAGDVVDVVRVDLPEGTVL